MRWRWGSLIGREVASQARVCETQKSGVQFLLPGRSCEDTYEAGRATTGWRSSATSTTGAASGRLGPAAKIPASYCPLCTHQGSVDNAYLAIYLDEFVFRFNRRRKRVGTHRAWSALQRTAPGELRARARSG